MEANKWYALFGFGMLGGILPTSAKLATTLVSVPGTPVPEIGFLVGLGIWAIIGGAVALTNTSKEVRQAIFAGIAAPAVLAGVVSGATGPAVGSATTAGLFGMSAVAQEDAPKVRNAAEDWTVIISPTVNGGIPTGKSLPVTAEVENDGKMKIMDVGTVANWRGPTALQIPPGTSQVFIGAKPVATTGPITNVDMSVETAPSIGGDLLWALGAQRNFNIQSVDVTPMPTRPDAPQ